MSERPPLSLPVASEPLPPAGFDDEIPFDWRGLFDVARRHAWLIIVLPVLGGLGGWAYLKRLVPLYEARSTLLVEEKQKVVKVDQVTEGSLESEKELNTVVATLSSMSFLEFVAEQKKWTELAALMDGVPAGERTPKTAAARAAGTLRAVVRAGTRLIDVYAQSPHPELARQLALDAAEGVIRYGMEQRMRTASVATDFLQEEVRRLKTKLESSEQALQAYRDEQQSVSLEEDQNLVVDQLKDLNSQKLAASANRLQLETDMAALKAIPAEATEAMLQLKSVATLPAVASTVQAITAREAEFSALKLRYKAKHPKYLAAAAELEQLQAQLRQVLGEARGFLQASYAAAQANEAKFEEALKAQEGESMQLDRIAIQYNVLKREVEADRQLYESTLNRLKEVDITKGLENSPLSLMDLPELPRVPVHPKPAQVMTGAIGAGGLLASGLIALLFFSDRSFKTVDQVEGRLQLPVLAAIASVPGARKNASNDLPEESHGAQAEAFRSLRTMASLLGPEDDRRTFLITSALPSEGKTFCACNFAHALAQQGLRTLLIDADLRRPRLAKALFGPKASLKPGLTEVLTRQVAWSESVHAVAASPGLSIMPAGEHAPNPAELLAGAAFDRLLAEMLQQFDRVVIDSAPVLAVSDTLSLARHLQTTLLVIKWSKTPQPAVQRALRLLEGAGRAPSGVVMNQMPRRDGRGYQYYYGYQSSYYGSAGVYGAKA